MITIESLEKKFQIQCQIVKGSKNQSLKRISPLHSLSAESLVVLKDKKALAQLSLDKEMDASLVTSNKIWEQIKGSNEEKLVSHFKHIALVADPSLAMALWSLEFYTSTRGAFNDFVDGRQMGTAKVHPTAMIAQGAFLGEGVEVEEGAVIHTGTVVMAYSKIGKNTVLFPNVTIYSNVSLGNNVRIHSGSVIGADGFGYYHHQGVHHKIWHFGGVEIGDNVEIGANSCVDGGTFTPTKIGPGTKLDNHVQIGHNVILGRGVMICGHVAIGGSTQVGDYTVFGGKGGSGDNYKIGAQCQIAGGALVNCDWPDKSIVGGHPARPLKEWMRGLAYVRKMSLRENSSSKDEE